MRDLADWTGTGTVENPRAGDNERLALGSGEYMISETVDTGAADIEIDYNVYQAGDAVTLQYRHGATAVACAAAAWQNYAGSFTSLGFVQAKVSVA